MRMWLDAIKSMGCELDIMFLLPHGTDVSTEAAKTLTSGLLQCWGIRAHVVLCEREKILPNTTRSSLKTFFNSMTSHAQHPFFASYSGERQKKVFEQCMQRLPDLVFFQKIYSMGPTKPALLRGTRVFLDLDDVEHLRFAREIGEPPHWRSKNLLYLEVPALWKGERASILQSERAFVCSDVDRKYLQRVMRIKNIETIPNAACWVADAPLTSQQNVLFVGNGRYGPNVVAASYLIEKVWPRLKKNCPKARLLIAGSGWESTPSFQARPEGVEFLGFVSDLEGIYRHTRVVCCPIWSGSGTRIKILEATAHGVPVISTSVGAEGLEFEPESEIILRDEAESLAGVCCDLLMDHSKASRIGIAGRERVRTLYSRDAIIEKIRKILTNG